MLRKNGGHSMNEFAQLQQLADWNRTQNAERIEDVLQVLWDSTAALHKRFDVTLDIEAQVALVREETEEAIAAALDEPDAALAHEIADSFVVLLGLAQARGVALDAVREGMTAVIWKNDRKTHDTHSVNPITGKITRKVR